MQTHCQEDTYLGDSILTIGPTGQCGYLCGHDIDTDLNSEEDAQLEVANLHVEGETYQDSNWNSLTADIMKYIQGCHATERFKLGNETKASFGLADLNWKTLKRLLKDGHFKAVGITKIPQRSLKKQEKFLTKNIESKRSVAFANNLLRGIALHEMVDELEITGSMKDDEKKARKALLNKFTNCSRRDRAAGLKLEREFIKKHPTLNKYSTYKDIDEYFKEISIFIFDSKGFLKHVSSRLSEKSCYFYEGKEEFFIIKNLKGFCRVDN